MTIKELIEKLSEYPQDKEVVFGDAALIFIHPTTIYEWPKDASGETFIVIE